jgi:hypothetical protein
MKEDDDIKSGREALDLAARLTSWAMLHNARYLQKAPRGNVIPFPRQAITHRDTLAEQPPTESTDDE